MWEHTCIKETEIALTQQSMANIEKKVDNIEKMLVSFIEKSDKTYAKKETVDTITKVLWTFWVAIILWMGGFIWQQIINLIWK